MWYGKNDDDDYTPSRKDSADDVRMKNSWVGDNSVEEDDEDGEDDEDDEDDFNMSNLWT